MAERKIYLNQILNRYLLKSSTLEINSEDFLLIQRAMTEAIKQALELAAENADADIDADESTYIEGNVWGIVNKQSILDTINQIE